MRIPISESQIGYFYKSKYSNIDIWYFIPNYFDYWKKDCREGTFKEFKILYPKEINGITIRTK